MCQDKLERVSAVKICVSERVSVGAHVSEIKAVYEYSSGCGGKSPSGLGCYQRSEGPVTSESSTENITCGLEEAAQARLSALTSWLTGS